MSAWIETWSGRQFTFDPVDPTAIALEDVAHHLSMQCRFTGAVDKLYSVAEHSVRVLLHVENHGGVGGSGGKRVATASARAWGLSPARWALLHDASEAYVSDINRPAKSLPELAGYKKLEARIMAAMAERFGLKGGQPRIVSEADLVLLQTERWMLKRVHGKNHAWSDLDDVKPCGACALGMGWDPLTAEVAFLAQAKRLGLK